MKPTMECFVTWLNLNRMHLNIRTEKYVITKNVKIPTGQLSLPRKKSRLNNPLRSPKALP